MYFRNQKKEGRKETMDQLGLVLMSIVLNPASTAVVVNNIRCRTSYVPERDGRRLKNGKVRAPEAEEATAAAPLAAVQQSTVSVAAPARLRPDFYTNLQASPRRAARVDFYREYTHYTKQYDFRDGVAPRGVKAQRGASVYSLGTGPAPNFSPYPSL